MTEDTQPTPTPSPDAAPAPPMPAAPPTRPGALVAPRSTAIWPNVIGILGIVLGCLAALGAIWQALSTVFIPWLADMMPSNAAVNPMPVMKEWVPLLFLSAAIMLAVAVFLIIASVGVMRLRPWSRMALLIWAIAKLVAGAGGVAIGFLMGTAMVAEMTTNGQPAMFVGGAVAQFISAIIQFAFIAILPVFLLIWLNLKKVKAEVNRWREFDARRAAQQGNVMSKPVVTTSNDPQ